MYACKSCGAGVRFDIEKQLLVCDACNSMTEPMEMQKEKDASESIMSVNVFECPQCGGTLYSDDVSITQYCSFCGGSTILSSRIANEKAPKQIIPFQITKEACREKYKNHVAKMIYAPKAYRDPEGVREFRAIYMPYWRYFVSHDQNATYLTEESDGDKTLVRSYEAKLQGKSDNIIFDGSSSFDDRISRAITPFDADQLKEFTPSYLCGFYADTADVPNQVYGEEAKAISQDAVKELVEEQIKKSGKKEKLSSESKIKSSASLSSVEGLLLPVWFLSYRKGKRVAYATVNGQTGEVEADLPVDPMKFIIGSIVFSLILFFVFQQTLFLKPKATLALTNLILAGVMWLYSKHMKRVFFKDHKLDDKGYQFKNVERDKVNQAVLALIQLKEKKVQDVLSGILGILGAIFFFICAVNLAGAVVAVILVVCYVFGVFGSFAVWFLSSTASLCFIAYGYSYISKTPSLNGLGSVFGMIAVALSGIIMILNPVSDLYYYVGCLAVMAAVLISAIDLIHTYNVMVTQPLPEFERNRGGEGDAQ